MCEKVVFWSNWWVVGRGVKVEFKKKNYSLTLLLFAPKSLNSTPFEEVLGEF